METADFCYMLANQTSKTHKHFCKSSFLWLKFPLNVNNQNICTNNALKHIITMFKNLGNPFCCNAVTYSRFNKCRCRKKELEKLIPSISIYAILLNAVKC
jgi:hypothetical protein